MAKEEDHQGDSSSPSTAEESASAKSDMTSAQVATLPEMEEAFDTVFGTAEAPATRKSSKLQSPEEDLEELEGLEGVGVDDGKDDFGEEDKDFFDDKEADAKPTVDAGQNEEEEGDESPTLDPILRQAAKRAGWDDDAINELAKANPEMAVKTFQKFLHSLNDISAEFGRLGGAGQQINQQIGMQPQAPQQIYQPPAPMQQGPSAPPAQPGQTDPLLEFYGPEKTKALRENYEDSFFTDVIGPLLQPLRQMKAMAEQQQMEAIGAEVTSFFKDAATDFGALYGEGDNCSPEQFENRGRVGQMADQIQIGASRQGFRMSTGECLGRANLMFAAEHMKEIERKKITTQVKKRSKQITQRPTQRKLNAANGTERSDQMAQDAYAAKATELGLDGV